MSFRTVDGAATTSDSDYIAKTGTNQEPGVRSQESGVRSQESGVRNQRNGRLILTPDP